MADRPKCARCGRPIAPPGGVLVEEGTAYHVGCWHAARRETVHRMRTSTATALRIAAVVLATFFGYQLAQGCSG